MFVVLQTEVVRIVVQKYILMR